MAPYLALLAVLQQTLPSLASDACNGTGACKAQGNSLLQGRRARHDMHVAQPYVPGEAGAPWSEDEKLAIRETLWRIYGNNRGGFENLACKLLGDEEYPCTLERFDPNVYESCDSENITDQAARPEIRCNGGSKRMSQGAIPSTAKFLRLGFHDCWLYDDGTGGCDGCMNFDGMFIIKNIDEPAPEEAGYRKSRLPYDILASSNNNLAATADILEEIYTNVTYGYQSNIIDVSLQDSGKSRADLWAFATLLAAEYTMNTHNQVCADPDAVHLYKEETLQLPHACEITPSRPFAFQTGRRDCSLDVRPPGRLREYESSKTEVTANPHSNGKEIVKFMADNFKLSGRETVALMGVHAVGTFTSVNGIFRYTWLGNELGQENYMNNLYYRVMSYKPMYLVDDLAMIQDMKAANEPVPGPSAISLIQNARGITPSKGPIQWFTGTTPVAGSGFASGRTHVGFLNTDIGLFLSFDTLDNGFPVRANDTHCTPLGTNVNSNDHYIDESTARSTCLQTEPAGDGKALWEVVEEYADDQDGWWADFTAVMEKMLANGYTSLHDNGFIESTTTTTRGANPVEDCSRSWCCGGIDSKSVCCAASCGSCGGSGCKERPGGADACCTSNIKDAGRGCQDKYDTVCLKPGSSSITSTPADTTITPATTTTTTTTTTSTTTTTTTTATTAECTKDYCCAGVAYNPVCCPASCGTCGGNGCNNRPGGAEACCKNNIQAAGRGCADKWDVQCLKPGSKYIVGTTTTTTTTPTTTTTSTTTTSTTTTTTTTTSTTTTTTSATGMTTTPFECTRSWCCTGLPSKSVCCAASCGGCGGSGCKNRPGGRAACCTNDIKDAGRGCQDKWDEVCLKPGSPDITT